MKRIDLSRYPSITMEEFLINYVLANGQEYIYDTNNNKVSLNDLSLLNHYDVSDLNIPGITRASFDEVTLEKLYRGEILLVRSSSWKGRGSMIIPYYRPQLVNGDLIAANLVKEHDEIIEHKLPSSYQLRRCKKKGR